MSLSAWFEERKPFRWHILLSWKPSLLHSQVLSWSTHWWVVCKLSCANMSMWQTNSYRKQPLLKPIPDLNIPAVVFCRHSWPQDGQWRQGPIRSNNELHVWNASNVPGEGLLILPATRTHLLLLLSTCFPWPWESHLPVLPAGSHVAHL